MRTSQQCRHLGQTVVGSLHRFGGAGEVMHLQKCFDNVSTKNKETKKDMVSLVPGQSHQFAQPKGEDWITSSKLNFLSMCRLEEMWPLAW